MRQILGYLAHHLRHHVHVRLHLAVALLLAAAFVFNYATGFKQNVMNAHGGDWLEPPLYLAFYAVPWLGTLLLQRRLTGAPLPGLRSFWWLAAFALAVLVLNRVTLSATARWAGGLELSPYAAWYLSKCVVNLTRTLEIVVPLALLRLAWDRHGEGLYGLTWRGFDWRPYLTMLAVMVAPIAWASFQPAFLATYPVFSPWRLEAATGWSAWWTYPVHEVCYALRFVGVELFFRGFLVIGLARWLGRDALLPMVVLYAFWHFGKPMPEALGSVFGGYLLGVVALESRSVLGGTLVHMGIALLMNLGALGQHWVRG